MGKNGSQHYRGMGIWDGSQHYGGTGIWSGEGEEGADPGSVQPPRAVPTLTAELPTHLSQRCTSPGIVCDLFDEAGLTSGTRVLLGGGGGGGWAELWVWDISRAHCCLRDRARPTAGQWEHRATGGHSPAMQHGPGGCHKGGLSYSEGGGCHMVVVGVS